MRLKFYSDPGHGWLEVPIETVRAVGFKPSRFSYYNDGMAYLEEDSDAPRFETMAREAGIEYLVEYNHHAVTPIRTYRRFL